METGYVAVSMAHMPRIEDPILQKRRLVTKQVMVNAIYPIMLQIALFGMFVLFLLYKCLLSLANGVLLLLEKLQKAADVSKKHLVIIGGGYAGTFTAMRLEREFRVTMIDTKDYFEFTPSRLRSLVEPTTACNIQIKHKKYLKNTSLVCNERVVGVNTEHVVTDHSTIPYDYLVISTGTRYYQPKWDPTNAFRVVSAKAPHLHHYDTLLAGAKSVLVVGGGTVGVELAAEILEKHRDKEIILVHSQSHLMNRSPLRAILYTEEALQKNGVRVLLKERVIRQQGRFFYTDMGTVVEADIAFLCTGNVPNSDFLANGPFAPNINDQGYIKVNAHLQMEGFHNIFVAGDIAYIPEEEEKLCQTAAAEVDVMLKNIRNRERGLPLHKYTPTPHPMLISLGKYDGMCTYKGYTMTGFLPAVMKEFVEWKEMVYYWDWKRFRRWSRRIRFRKAARSKKVDVDSPNPAREQQKGSRGGCDLQRVEDV